MKKDRLVLGNAFALTAGIYYAGCYILALIAPQLFLKISASWFHMFNLEQIENTTLTDPEQFLFGMMSCAINAWIFGFLLGWSVELFNRKK